MSSTRAAWIVLKKELTETLLTANVAAPIAQRNDLRLGVQPF